MVEPAMQDKWEFQELVKILVNWINDELRCVGGCMQWPMSAFNTPHALTTTTMATHFPADDSVISGSSSRVWRRICTTDRSLESWSRS